MSLIEVVPEELRVGTKREDFLSWLKLMPGPLHTKKFILLDWCEYTGTKMKREYAEAVGIPPQI